MNPLLTCALSGAKMPESTQDLKRLLLCLEQRRRICSDATERVCPLGARRPLGVEPECRRIEEDSLALDLLYDGPLGQDVFERLVVGQAATREIEAAQLEQRMILVANRRADSVFGAQIAHEDRDDQGVGFVPRHLHEPGRAQGAAFLISQVPEELHLEEATRLRTGDPWRATAPCASLAERLELLVHALDSMLGKAI